jgi:hypothetical protein
VLWQIGAALNLNAKAAKQAVSRIGLDRVMGRNHLSTLVKRYLSDAVKSIESVGQGVFPAPKPARGKSSVKKNDT